MTRKEFEIRAFLPTYLVRGPGAAPSGNHGPRLALADVARGRVDKMAGEKQNLQDAFLNHIRKGKVPVTIFLVNGVKLQGVITWFDNFCVLLRRDGQSQLVYKHAISTVMPGMPITLYQGDN